MSLKPEGLLGDIKTANVFQYPVNFFFYIFLIFAQNIDCGYTFLRVPTIYVLEQK